MAAPIPTKEPDVLYAKDTWKWTKSVPDFSALDGWQLSYVLHNRNGTDKLTLAWGQQVTQNGSTSGFSIVVPTTDTGLAAGNYSWISYLTKAAERFAFEEGALIIRPDYAGATGGSLKTHDEKVLAAIRAVIEGRVTADIENYQVFGRAVTKIPVADLIKFERIYTARVWLAAHPGAGLFVPVEVVTSQVD